MFITIFTTSIVLSLLFAYLFTEGAIGFVTNLDKFNASEFLSDVNATKMLIRTFLIMFCLIFGSSLLPIAFAGTSETQKAKKKSK